MKGIIELLKYMDWCCGGLRNKSRRKQMMKFETSDCLMVEHCGERYPGRLVYMIKVNGKYSGWFSIMNKILSALTLADSYGLTPVIDMGYSALYSEPSMVVSGIPLFEYYFCQPSRIQLTEVKDCRNVIYVTDSHCTFVDSIFRNNEQYIQESKGVQQLASVIAKFISLNTKTETYISKKINETLVGNKILGVHVRGTDFKVGFNDHAIYVTTEEYIEHVQKTIEKYQYDRIFLATDEEDAIKKFQETFGDMVVYHDVYRAEGDTDIGIHCSKSDRELHHYKLGLEVLLDMYSLAACDALVACPSGVSFHAMLNKRARGGKYEYMDIIDKGRYKSRKVSNVEIGRIFCNME